MGHSTLLYECIFHDKRLASQGVAKVDFMKDANIQYVDWRPSSTDVVYVYNNDIRMKRIGSDGKLGDEIRLTSSGVPGRLCKFSCNVLSKQIFHILIFDHEL